MDLRRRHFFTKTLVHKALSCVTETLQAYERGQSEADYFKSFESAYPLISECYDFLEDEAAKLGIDTKDKSKLELAKEIHVTLEDVAP